MARQKSLLKVEGTLDELTFYKSGDRYLVRTKGGIDGNRIKTDPSFARTRENIAEFRNVSKAGKVLRDVFKPIVGGSADSELISRMVKVLSEIKNLDTTSQRGFRKVGIGLNTLEGQKVLLGFSYNSRSVLTQIFSGKLEADQNTGKITINDFIGNEQLRSPESATHVGFQTMWANIDFESGEQVKGLSTEIVKPLDNVASNIVLTPPGPSGTGIYVQVIKLNFYQELNGQQYLLKNGATSPVEIVFVGS